LNPAEVTRSPAEKRGFFYALVFDQSTFLIEHSTYSGKVKQVSVLKSYKEAFMKMQQQP